MKKVVCLALCLMLTLLTMGSAYAKPCYAYIDSTKANLIINSGEATVIGRIVPIGDMKTSIAVRLQRENQSGSWATIATWTGSNGSGQSEAGGTRSITAGYNYRVYVTGKVYNSAGAIVETVDKYSAIKPY